MKNFFLAFLVFLVYSIFGMWYFSCKVKGLCGIKEENIITETNTPVKKDTMSPKEEKILNNLFQDSFIIRDKNGDPLFSFKENFKINSSEGSILIPASIEAFKDSIYNYLNVNQTKELVITGLRSATETNSMALERANEMKAILVDFGVNGDKISVKESVADITFNTKGEAFGGVNFNISELSVERLSEIETGIANKILYSGFGSKGFRPDNTLQAYALELKNYLEKYSNKTATITGHTDSVGDNIANDWFGMERAKNVKKYLISQGIDANRLSALSKGETEPLDTNKTLEGRRKNRRIEIKVN